MSLLQHLLVFFCSVWSDVFLHQNHSKIVRNRHFQKNVVLIPRSIYVLVNSAYRDFVCNDIPAHTITEPRTICPRSIKHGPLKRSPFL